MKPFAIALLVCSVSIQSVLAQGRKNEDPTTTGNALLQTLQDGKNDFIEGMAWGYIFAVAHTQTNLLPMLVPSGTSNSCPPGGVTNKQIIDIVRRYLEDNPETRHEAAYVLISRALVKSFPCPKGPK
jgi:Ssp1 endopeptidase immunity protein Rap1a